MSGSYMALKRALIRATQRRPAYPARQAATYLVRVRPYLADMRDALMTELTHAARVAGLLNDAVDTPARGHRAVEEAKRELGRRWSDKRLGNAVRPVAEEVDRLSKANVGKVLGIPSAEVPGTEKVPAWVESNVALIRTVADRYVDQVADIVSEGFREGARWEELVPQLQERADVAESNAERIARTETAKLSAELTRDRFESFGVDRAVWRTCQDERVRDEHADLEGQEYDLIDGIDGLFPGQEPNCRCWDEPILEGL